MISVVFRRGREESYSFVLWLTRKHFDLDKQCYVIEKARQERGINIQGHIKMAVG
jgi:hypothetical protein